MYMFRNYPLRLSIYHVDNFSALFVRPATLLDTRGLLTTPPPPRAPVSMWTNLIFEENMNILGI